MIIIWLYLDVDALFTNIPLDEIIDICVKKLFKTPDTSVKGIFKNDFCDLLNLATKESFFTLSNKFYIQLDGIEVFIEGMLMIFSYFLNHLSLPTRPLNIRT